MDKIDASGFPPVVTLFVQSVQFIEAMKGVYTFGSKVGNFVSSLFPSNKEFKLLANSPNSSLSAIAPPIPAIDSDTLMCNATNAPSFSPPPIEEMICSIKTSLGDIPNVQNSAEPAPTILNWAVDGLAAAGSTLDQKIGENIPFVPTAVWNGISPGFKIGFGLLLTLCFWRMVRGSSVSQNVTIVYQTDQSRDSGHVQRSKPLKSRVSKETYSDEGLIPYQDDEGVRSLRSSRKKIPNRNSSSFSIIPGVSASLLGAGIYYWAKDKLSAKTEGFCPVPNPFSAVCENPDFKPSLKFKPDDLLNSSLPNLEDAFSSAKETIAGSLSYENATHQINNLWNWAYENMASAASSMDQKIGANIPLLPTFFWDRISPTVKIGTGLLLGLCVWRLIRGSNVTQKVTIEIPNNNSRKPINVLKKARLQAASAR